MAISCCVVKIVQSCSDGHVRAEKKSSASLLKPVLSSFLQLLHFAVLILFKLLVSAFKLLKLPGDLANRMLLWFKGQIGASVSWLWSNNLVVKSSSSSNSLLKLLLHSLLQRLKPSILFLCQLPRLVLRLMLIIKLPYNVAVAIATSMKTNMVSIASRYSVEEIKMFWFDPLVRFTRTTWALLGSLPKDATAKVASITISSATNLFHRLHKTSSSFARSAHANAKIMAVKFQESLTFFVLGVYQATSEFLERAKQDAVAALSNLCNDIVVHVHKLREELSNAMNMFWENARKAAGICAGGAEAAADVLYDLCIDVYVAIVRSWMQCSTTGLEKLRRLLRMPRVLEISAALGGGHVCAVGSCLLGLGLVVFVAWAHASRRR